MAATSAGSSRTVTVRLAADVNSFIAAMAKASAATQSMATGLAKASQTQSWSTVSNDLLKVGAVATAVVGLVSKAAMDWQSDFTGVTKTVDGTTEQMGALEDQLRSMARSMPETHENIAAVAEAAGQLGIAREDVAKFSEVMIQLGATTNLTADEAATSLAQFMNIMGTSADNVDRLGATLVQLGNNGASTEAEIMELSARLAGVGKQMNMSEADVMGMANAMASVGINAEAGGTAMTLTLKGIDAAVRSGGKELETYARTAGMSAQEFASAWGKDAAGATAGFIEGLGKMKASGEDMNAVLDELGIDGERQADVLIRLAGATKAAGAQNDLLRDSLEMGAQAYQQNAALTDEYAKRVSTAKSQITIAWNNIKDAAISAGESTLPVIGALASGVSGLASFFGGLPAPILATGAGFTALTGAAALTAGGLMKGVSAVAEFKNAADSLGISVRDLGGRFGQTALAAGIFAAAMTALGAAGSAWQESLDKSRLSADSMVFAMQQLADKGSSARLDESFTASFRDGETAVNALDLAFARVNSSGGGFLEWAETSTAHIFQMKGTIEATREEFAKMDSALVSMDPGQAAQAFAVIREQADSVGTSLDQLVGYFPEYAAQLESSANSMGVYNLSQKELVDWMGGVEPAAVTAAKALAALGIAHVDAGASAAEQDAALRSLFDTTQDMAAAAMAADSAEIAYAQALDKATAAAQAGGITIDETTGKIDLHTEAGQAASAALIDMANSHTKAAQAALDDGASMEEVTAMTQTARDEFVAVATQMGLTGDQAEALADRYGLIPGELSTDISLTGADEATSKAEAVKAMIDTLPLELQVMIKSAYDDAARATAQASLDGLPPETQAMIMSAWDAGGYDTAVASLALVPPEKRAQILSTWDAAGVNAAIAGLNSVQSKTVTITTNYVVNGYPTISTGARDFKEAATGGSIWGPGTSTSDSIPAWLSNGEFVIRTAAAERLGYGVLDYINRWGQLPGYAAGGQVAPLSRQLVQSAAPVVNVQAVPASGDYLTRADLDGLGIKILDPGIGKAIAAEIVLTAKRV